MKEPEAGLWTVKVLLFDKVYLLLYFDASMFSKVCTIVCVYLLLQSWTVLLLRSNLHSAFVGLLVK